MQRRRTWIVGAILLLVAFGLRVAVARYLANDTPADEKIYALLAHNLLEHQVYSHDAEPPYGPSLIRLPGYPFFLTAIYYFFGHENNTAVRIAQALIDTVTCALIGLLAYISAAQTGRCPCSNRARSNLSLHCDLCRNDPH